MNSIIFSDFDNVLTIYRTYDAFINKVPSIMTINLYNIECFNSIINFDNILPTDYIYFLNSAFMNSFTNMTFGKLYQSDISSINMSNKNVINSNIGVYGLNQLNVIIDSCIYENCNETQSSGNGGESGDTAIYISDVNRTLDSTSIRCVSKIYNTTFTNTTSVNHFISGVFTSNNYNDVNQPRLIIEFSQFSDSNLNDEAIKFMTNAVDSKNNVMNCSIMIYSTIFDNIIVPYIINPISMTPKIIDTLIMINNLQTNNLNDNKLSIAVIKLIDMSVDIKNTQLSDIKLLINAIDPNNVKLANMNIVNSKVLYLPDNNRSHNASSVISIDSSTFSNYFDEQFLIFHPYSVFLCIFLDEKHWALTSIQNNVVLHNC